LELAGLEDRWSVPETVLYINSLTSERLDETNDDRNVRPEASDEENGKTYAESPILVPDRPSAQCQDDCNGNNVRLESDRESCFNLTFS
jgi:hypothetical protein